MPEIEKLLLEAEKRIKAASDENKPKIANRYLKKIRSITGGHPYADVQDIRWLGWESPKAICYKQSPDYKALRRLRHAIDKHACQSCHSRKDLNLHHHVYERFLKNGGELIEDVGILCRVCHQEFHDEQRKVRKALEKKMSKQIVSVFNTLKPFFAKPNRFSTRTVLRGRNPKNSARDNRVCRVISLLRSAGVFRSVVEEGRLVNIPTNATHLIAEMTGQSFCEFVAIIQRSKDIFVAGGEFRQFCIANNLPINEFITNHTQSVHRTFHRGTRRPVEAIMTPDLHSVLSVDVIERLAELNRKQKSLTAQKRAIKRTVQETINYHRQIVSELESLV